MKLLSGYLALAVSTVLTVFGASQSTAQQFFPDTGIAAVTQRCRDIQGNLSVMNISLRPGHEDFSTLAYLRMDRGAQILSVYVTNGETEESDMADLYPFEIAVERREEAASAISMLESEIHCMNMPDIASAATADDIQQQWPQDTMIVRFIRLIGQFKPDLILLPSGNSPDETILYDAIKKNLMIAVRELAARGNEKRKFKEAALSPWNVTCVAIHDGGKKGVAIPVTTIHPVFKKTYEKIGDEIASCYHSLSVQRRARKGGADRRYMLLNTPKGIKNSKLDAILKGPMPLTLKALDQTIRTTLGKIIDTKTPVKSRIVSLLPVMASVDKAIIEMQESRSRERRIVLNWKEGLEKLRIALMGITVSYDLSFSVLVERQLVEFRIDSIANMPKAGETTVLFSMVDQGWFVNEAGQSRLPLKLKEAYRLVTPVKVDYDLPASRYYQQRATVSRPVTVIIIHTGSRKDENFVYRIAPRIRFAPRFTAEVITPIVRCYDGEKLIVRLTNHSRDGVADKLDVRDSIAYSNIAKVALSSKEKSEQDTLTLTWYGALPDSSYIVPVEYGGVKISQFLGRKFPVVIDTAKHIGIITGRERSQTVEALRRLGLKTFSLFSDRHISSDAFRSLNAVIIDRRAMTLRSFTQEERQTLVDFANGGGHVIILAQDAVSWNNAPLLENIRLSPTIRQTENLPVECDSNNIFLRSPNVITEKDFDGWLLQRAYNTVEMEEGTGKRVITAEGGNPLLVTTEKGKGRITYVDLALAPQFMNVHQGAMRLLANLISR